MRRLPATTRRSSSTKGNPGRTELFIGTLGVPVDIPVVGLSFADALALYAQIQAGQTVVVRVFTSTEVDLEAKTTNVIADSPGGDADKVLVVGAHLDSVVEGPGINDNGSGSSTILEIAEEMAELKIKPRQKVRFAFWGAEEANLLGSEHYVNTLSDDKLAKIFANLNFDMLGSTNYVRFVYDGDGSDTPDPGPPGSAEIEQIFNDYFASQGSRPNRPPSTVAPTTGRSSPSASRPAACSAGPRASRQPRRRPSTAAPPASRTTPATTRRATRSTTSAPRPCSRWVTRPRTPC